MKRKHSPNASITIGRSQQQSMKVHVDKSVRFADAKFSSDEDAPPRVPPAALSIILDEEKTNIWYTVDDVNQFKLSARILALRVRGSPRQRAMDEDEINSTRCERRRSSLQNVYNRNMDKASQDVQTYCLDMDTDEVRNLWDGSTVELDNFEAHGVVPRGLELQISFSRQRRQKVGVIKLLEYQNKFKTAIADDSGSDDNEGTQQNGIPAGYTLSDVLASALRRESRWSCDTAQVTGRDDFIAAYPSLSPALDYLGPHSPLLSSSSSPIWSTPHATGIAAPLATIDEDIQKQAQHMTKKAKRHPRSMPLYLHRSNDTAAIVSDDNG